jgi:hypothetical protein
MNKLVVAGQAWAAATTEGLLIYSLDAGMVFDPFLLDESITPDSIRRTLQDGDWPKGRDCLVTGYPCRMSALHC